MCRSVSRGRVSGYLLARNLRTASALSNSRLSVSVSVRAQVGYEVGTKVGTPTNWQEKSRLIQRLSSIPGGESGTPFNKRAPRSTSQLATLDHSAVVDLVS